MEQSQNLIQELVWKMTIHIYNLLLHQDLPPIQGNIIMKLARITLEYEIRVPVRLLISQIFSHWYTLISDGTFIEIGIFRNLKRLWTFGKNSKS